LAEAKELLDSLQSFYMGMADSVDDSVLVAGDVQKLEMRQQRLAGIGDALWWGKKWLAREEGRTEE
jgi:hypothetical protein